MVPTFEQIRSDAALAGLDLRGAFHPDPGEIDGHPGEGRRTLVLLGFAGSSRFAGFAASPEYADGGPHPLDRWSRRLVDHLAASWGGVALFPFGGPPWHPFQRWARRAEPLFPSPIGLLIHPTYGLWHSYRGAVLLDQVLELPGTPDVSSPCDRCATRPCLSACPVGAYAPGAFDPDACAAHVRAPQGHACLTGGCLARQACPVGAEHAHGPEQAAFTTRAFLLAR